FRFALLHISPYSLFVFSVIFPVSSFSSVSRIRPPPRCTLFPYTTLFRSARVGEILEVFTRAGTHYKCSWRSAGEEARGGTFIMRDRKSTRLNSSHVKISYAVFCLKKKIRKAPPIQPPSISTCVNNSIAFS